MVQPSDAAGPSYTPRHTLSGHTRAVTALRFSSDGRSLVSAGADGYVHFWDASSGAHQRVLRCHRTGINDISLSPDGLYLSTASDDGTAQVFSTDPLSAPRASQGPVLIAPPLRSLAAHTAPVLAVAFSPTSNLVVTGSMDESAIVWDVRRGKSLRTLPAHAEAIWSVGWDAEGALVITGSADGLIRLWDANTGQCLKTFDNESNAPVSSASFTPSSFFILSSTLSSTIRIYSLHTAKVLKTFQAAEYVSEKFPTPAIVFAAPGGALANGHDADDAMDVDGVAGVGTVGAARVVAGSENGHVVIWDLQDRRVVQVLEGHDAPVVALAVHPDGRTIATGALEPDKKIKVWQWQ
ncbi:WD repeat-containing protein 5 [Vanrija pseudolonga]|uniref:WD repeat-containing protein 5 n=1 Tax=Vanrija pseudolonga TaxID=143232 RepID=A0AAF0Y750_9TREE|nr:WD repeat-containing protein 5 [Vanrija pseudolonga]